MSAGVGGGAGGSSDDSGGISNPNNKCIIHPSAPHLIRKCHVVFKYAPLGSTVSAQEAHSRLLHGYTQIATFHVQRYNLQFSESSTPLLIMQEIATPHGSIIGFWDGGSTLCLNSRGCAMRLNLVGVDVVCELLTVGGKVTIMNTILYEVDRDNEIHTLRMFTHRHVC